MDDKDIVMLYWQRDERAIYETDKKYKKYLQYIANNILSSDLESEECVNDTYSRAWGSIPPSKPDKLSLYLGKIVRNLAIDRYNASKAQKREGNYDLAYEELSEIIEDGSLSSPADQIALRDAINSFLGSLPEIKRVIFLQRYWYNCSTRDIAVKNGLSEINVKVSLMRLRKKLKKHLEKEGIVL